VDGLVGKYRSHVMVGKYSDVLVDKYCSQM
jgi:hypothetical protein